MTTKANQLTYRELEREALRDLAARTVANPAAPEDHTKAAMDFLERVDSDASNMSIPHMLRHLPPAAVFHLAEARRILAEVAHRAPTANALPESTITDDDEAPAV